MRLQSRGWLGLQLPKGWNGAEDPFLSSVTGLLTVDPRSSSHGHPTAWLTAWQLAFPRTKYERRERGGEGRREGGKERRGSCSVFCDLVLEVAYHYFYHFCCWSHRPTLVGCERESHKGMTTRSWGSLGTLLKAGYLPGTKK